jgi:hypothetical protein
MFPVKAFCLRGFRGRKGKSRAVKAPVFAAADWRAISLLVPFVRCSVELPQTILGLGLFSGSAPITAM